MGEEQEVSLQDFLKQLSREIEGGVEGRQIKDSIKVEMSVVKKIDVSGKIKLFVFNGGGGYQEEGITRINFEYYPKRGKINYQGIPSKPLYHNTGI